MAEPSAGGDPELEPLELQYLSVSPKTHKPTATVIFIHGLGDTGFGWRPLADVLSKDPDLERVKWILPHAPLRRVTANRNAPMPAWYNLLSFSPPTEDIPTALQSARALDALIDAEIQTGRMESARVILGGLSQGAAMTLLTGLTTRHKLAGLIVLSGRVPLRDTFASLPLSPHIRELPIFWGHGMDDPVVPYELGLKSLSYLETELGIAVRSRSISPLPSDTTPTTTTTTSTSITPSSATAGTGTGTDTTTAPAPPIGVEFHAYEGLGHMVCDEEVDDLRGWLKRVIPPIPG